MMIFNRHLTIELINGCGVFLVWTVNKQTEEVGALPFMGLMLYLPFILITFGQVYEQD
jgi:hypothetical protein